MISNTMQAVENFDDGRKCTMSPSCTGASVIGIKYKGGIMLAADTLVSYGSLARYMGFNRITQVNETTIMGCSGDMADFQLVKRKVDEFTKGENLLGDGFTMRSNFNPLWNSYIVGGLEANGQPFLGFCNMIGVATGIGAFLARPHLINAIEKVAGGDYHNLEEVDALNVISECMTLLCHNDCRAWDKYQLAIARTSGVELRGNLPVKTSWDIADYPASYE